MNLGPLDEAAREVLPAILDLLAAPEMAAAARTWPPTAVHSEVRDLRHKMAPKIELAQRLAAQQSAAASSVAIGSTLAILGDVAGDIWEATKSAEAGATRGANPMRGQIVGGYLRCAARRLAGALIMLDAAGAFASDENARRLAQRMRGAGLGRFSFSACARGGRANEPNDTEGKKE
jgi:hypothetical protein